MNMKMLRRILLAVAVCAPAFMANIGCGSKSKVYVDEEVKADTTTGDIEYRNETRVKDK